MYFVVSLNFIPARFAGQQRRPIKHEAGRLSKQQMPPAAERPVCSGCCSGRDKCLCPGAKVEILLPGMRVNLTSCFRTGMALLALALAWSLWAGAQTVTNPAPAAGTNPPSAFVSSLERLDRHYLTFGLDRLAPLRDNAVLGEPLWKYLASLIYILLAFYVSKLH